MSRSSQDCIVIADSLGTPGSYDIYGGYPPSLDYNSGLYQHEGGYSSTTRLTDSVGPMGISYPPNIASPPESAPSFPPRSASPAPHPSSSMRPSRSKTQLSAHTNHAPYTPSSLTPGGAYNYRQSPPTPSGGGGYSSSSQYPSNQYSHFGRNSGGSSGLAYDRPDTDVDVDAYSDNRGPAPSYFSAPASGRRVNNDQGGYGGYGGR